MLRPVRRPPPRVLRHRLPEGDGGGLDRLITDRAIRRAAALLKTLPDPAELVIPAAADAAGVSGIAMQLDDVLGGKPGRLMQVVDVLGDDGRDLASLIERGERAVAAPRLGRREGRFHRKAPPPGFGPRFRTGDEF